MIALLLKIVVKLIPHNFIAQPNTLHSKNEFTDTNKNE